VEIPIGQPQASLKEIPKPKQHSETGLALNRNFTAVGTHQLLRAVPRSSEYSENDLGHGNEPFHANGDDMAIKPAHELHQENGNHKAKRKRNRRRSDSKQLSMQMKDKFNGRNSRSSDKYDGRMVSRQVSKETQTKKDSRTKIKERRKKLNLLTLLEKAALLEGSDISTDEESILNIMKERSHLVKEEPYSWANLDGKEVIGAKRPTLEELLLQNFDEPSYNLPRKPVSTAATADPHHGGKAHASSTLSFPQEKRNISQKTDSSTQTFVDIQVPNFNVHDRPKAAAGPSWSELISISNSKKMESAVNSTSYMKEIGIQVSDFDPAVDKIEQMSQTDFTQDKDVAALLLRNLQGERFVTDQGSKEPTVQNELLKGEDRYPWQYVADTDFSDVAIPKKETKPADYTNAPGKPQQEDTKYNEGMEREFIVKNAPNKEAKDHAELQSNRVNFPPELFLEMKFHEDYVRTKLVDDNQTSQPLQVVDISKPSSPLGDSEGGKKHIVIEDIAMERSSGNVETDDRASKTEWEIVNDSIQEGLSQRQVYEAEEDAAQSKQHTESALENRQSQLAAQSEKFKKLMKEGPKDRLHSNLRNMSIQLDALDELYNQLEREMKNSSMLMNFVETVHHGFFEEPEVFKRVPTRYKKDGKAIPRYQKDHQTVAGDEGLVGVHKTEPKALQMEESLEEESVPISEKDKSNEHKDVNSERNDSLNDFLHGGSGEDATTRGDGYRSIESSGDSEGTDVISEDGQSSLVVPRKAHQDDEPAKAHHDGEQAHAQRNDELAHKTSEKDRIRERIVQKFPTTSKRRIEEEKTNAELNLKKKLESKRKALQIWMKNRRSERNEQYLKEIEEKRQKESRPFSRATNASNISNGPQSKSKIWKPNKKQKVNEENYKDRIDDAQKLLGDLYAVRSDAVSVERSARPVVAQIAKKKPKLHPRQKLSAKVKREMVDVYGKNVSRSRKTGAQNSRVGGSKVGQLLLDNISPSWKNSDLSDILRDVSNYEDDDTHSLVLNDMHLDLGPYDDHDGPHVSTARSGSNRYKLDLGKLSSRGTPDLGSGRAKSHRSPGGRDFITRKSMDNYRKKTAKLVRESMKDYGSAEVDGFLEDFSGSSTLGSIKLNSTDFLTENERFMVDRIMDERRSNEENSFKEAKRKRTKSPRRNVEESKDVNDILLQYGLLDEDMDQHNAEETSKLLAEADALLMVDTDEDEIKKPEEIIDWNEIDNSLNQN